MINHYKIENSILRSEEGMSGTQMREEFTVAGKDGNGLTKGVKFEPGLEA